jgi:hypothetical protein
MICEATQLKKELIEFGFKHVEIRDSKCYLPSLRWLEKFAEWFVPDLPDYAPEKYDCDDFAIRALDRSNDALRKAGKIQNAGHAFGYATIKTASGSDWFGQPGPIYHACNIMCSQSGWYYFEPSLGLFDKFENLNETISDRCFGLL